MNKKRLKRAFRSCFPDSPLLRKWFTAGQILLLKRHLMPEKEVLLGENSLEKKKELVEKYSRKWQKHVASAKRIARTTLQNAPCYQQSEQHDELFTDMLFCRLAYGFQPDEYCYFSLHDKSPDERKQFVSSTYRQCFKFAANEFDDMTFADKHLSYQRLKQFYGRDAAAINGPADYQTFISFIEKHPVFVKKQVDQSCGKSVELVDSTRQEDKKQLFDMLTAQGKLILEELLIQSDKMAVFNQSSVNTVRCFSFTTRNGVIIPFCFLRTGRKGAFVDNAGSGGAFAAVDPISGIVMADAIDELGSRYESHPDSGVQYKGFQIPEWNMAIALCKEAAASVPRNKYIGWDLAYTPNGWRIVEGNTSGQLVQQGSLQKGLRPELDNLIDQMDLIVDVKKLLKK